jgi:hypothetical protein
MDQKNHADENWNNLHVLADSIRFCQGLRAPLFDRQIDAEELQIKSA